MIVSVELELLIYVFALFKGLAGLHLTLKQRKADNNPWYRKKLRNIEGAVIFILLTSVFTLLVTLVPKFLEYPLDDVVGQVAILSEVVNTVLLAIFMIYIVWKKVGYASTRER